MDRGPALLTADTIIKGIRAMDNLIADSAMGAYLGKWPRLVVVGQSVTPEQAMEILIRTDSLLFSSNDHSFSRQCASYVYGVEPGKGSGYWCLSDVFQDEDGKTDWVKYEETYDKAKEELQLIQLRHLSNCRVTSNYVGGPHGWCDWNGRINCGGYNIGKWPSVGDVYEDWLSIAQAFPYLDLKCQLIADEGEGELVVEFEVRDGKVSVRPPNAPLVPDAEPDLIEKLMEVLHNPIGSRGCSLEYFKKTVDHVRARVLTSKKSHD